VHCHERYRAPRITSFASSTAFPIPSVSHREHPVAVALSLRGSFRCKSPPYSIVLHSLRAFSKVSSEHLSPSMGFSIAAFGVQIVAYFAPTVEESGRRIYRSPQHQFCAFWLAVRMAPIDGCVKLTQLHADASGGAPGDLRHP
jgi:hypothetical protein